MRVIVIAAVAAPSGLIGVNDELPWKLPEDMRRFRQATLGHAVIMGRKTWESLGSRPLPDRFNIVVSSGYHPGMGDQQVTSLAQAILAAKAEKHEKAFIIGGAQIYRAALPICDEAQITIVQAPDLVEGDAFFDLGQLSQMALLKSEQFPKDRNNPYDMEFERWVR